MYLVSLHPTTGREMQKTRPFLVVSPDELNLHLDSQSIHSFAPAECVSWCFHPEAFMPKVSEFFGIAIYIYWRDHAPPHFHAVYGEHEAVVDIRELRVTSGHLPARALGLVVEWATRHQPELLRVWGKAEAMEPLDWIEPLA